MKSGKLLLFLSLGITLCVLQGCALFGRTMSKKECQTADWKSQGIADAAAGEIKAEMTNFYKEECELDNQIAVDWKKYEIGYTEGLKTYCSSSKGYQNGVNGVFYTGACDATGKERFLEGFKKGYSIYLSNKIHRTDNEIIEKSAKQSRLWLELNSLTSKNRASDESKIKSLSSDIDRLIRELEELQTRRLKLERERTQYL